MTSYKDYKHIIPIQIRFSDIDRLDHVNNACYHNYFELGRVRYFSEVFREAINWDEKGFVLARTEIDHLEPVFLNDSIFCCTRISRIGTKSITVNNVLLKQEKGQYLECASGIGVLVAMDYAAHLSIPVPAEWSDRIRSFENL